MSDIFFDVGDQSELDTIYADQLSAAARYDLTVAIKHQEVIGPNLPLAYGLASVDGFDGGILPLKAYTQLMSAMTGQEGFAADGRLREYLDAIPAARWLDLLNVGYVITDKVGDTWHQGKFFDQQHPQTIEPNGAPAEVGHVPAYEATELWLIAEGPAGSVQLETTDGRRWELEPTATAAGPLLVRFPTPAMLDKIVLQPCHGCGEPWDIAALTLVDGRDDTFQPLVLGSFRLIHSGDVKIYENLDVLPRAFVAPEWRVASSTEEALRIMADEAFDPAATAVLTGSGPDPIVGAGGQAAIIEDRAEQVRIQVTSAAGGLLVLTDADYPGWEASIDGERAPNYTADVLFRGVWVPAGHHEVTFRYAPGWMPAGFYLSFLGVVVSAAALTRRRNRPPAAAG
jgi:hypothetical protein